MEIRCELLDEFIAKDGIYLDLGVVLLHEFVVERIDRLFLSSGIHESK